MIKKLLIALLISILPIGIHAGDWEEEELDTMDYEEQALGGSTGSTVFSGNAYPSTDNTYTSGKADARWSEGHFVNLNADGTVIFTGTVDFSSATTSIDADTLDGQHGSYYAIKSEVASSTGTLKTATDLNTTHRSSNGTDHGFIDQSVVTTSSPTFGALTLNGDFTAHNSSMTTVTGTMYGDGSNLTGIAGSLPTAYQVNTDSVTIGNPSYSIEFDSDVINNGDYTGIDTIDDKDIDWGTGTDQVDADDVPYTNTHDADITNVNEALDDTIEHASKMTEDTLLEGASVQITVSGGVASFVYKAKEDGGSFAANINQVHVTITSGTITITGGTDAVPKHYWVYSDSGTNIFSSITDPNTLDIKHAEIGEVTIGAVATTSATVMIIHDSMTNEDEILHDISHRLYNSGGLWESGGAIVFSGTGERTVSVSSTTGFVGKEEFKADYVFAGDTFIWVNDPDGAYSRHTSVDMAKYANGDALTNNKRFNVVFFITLVNGNLAELYMLMETGATKYNSLLTAENDANNQTVYTMTDILKNNSVLIGRAIYLRTGGANVKQDFTNTASGAEYKDLRGVPSAVAGGGGGGGGSEIRDDAGTTYVKTEETPASGIVSIYADGVFVASGTTSGLTANNLIVKISVDFPADSIDPSDIGAGSLGNDVIVSSTLANSIGSLQLQDDVSISTITNTTSIRLKSSGDNDDYLELITVSNVTRIRSVGGIAVGIVGDAGGTRSGITLYNPALLTDFLGTIYANNVDRDIVIDADNDIELVDDTNVTGSLDVSVDFTALDSSMTSVTGKHYGDGSSLTGISGGGGDIYIEHIFTIPGTIGTGDDQTPWYVSTTSGIVDGIVAVVKTVSSSGNPTIMLSRSTDNGGSFGDVLSTPLTIDVSERSSVTAATPVVINAAADDVDYGDILRIDIDTSGTGTKDITITVRIKQD